MAFSPTPFDCNADNLFDVLSTHPAVLVHVDATWNGPFQTNRVKLEKLRNICCRRVHIVRMDVDDPRNRDLLARLKLLNVPFFSLYVDGELRATQTGMGDAKSLEKSLRAAEASIPWYW